MAMAMATAKLAKARGEGTRMDATLRQKGDDGDVDIDGFGGDDDFGDVDVDGVGGGIVMAATTIATGMALGNVEAGVSERLMIVLVQVLVLVIVLVIVLNGGPTGACAVATSEGMGGVG